MVGFNNKIRELASDLGADFYGVADLTPAREVILEQGGKEVAAFPRGISIGIELLYAIVDQLPRRSERAVALNYSHHGYDIVNQRLDLTTSRLSSALQREGYKALPIPAAKRVDDERICAAFSHKLAAHLAGLGWIGKSCLLINPQVGPRVRWSTILTDAPLHPTGKAMNERCGTCQECVDVCPTKAFTGRPFHANEPREMRFDARKCEEYQSLDETTGLPVCGMCIYICPYGKSRNPKVRRQGTTNQKKD